MPRPRRARDMDDNTATDRIDHVLAGRYASPEMRAIWSPRGRVVMEREFWIAVMKAQRDLGLDIPQEAIEAYERVKDQVDLESINARERVTRHDVKARIEEFCDLAGYQHIHKGMTSRDLTENVEQLQVWRSMKLIHDKAVAALTRMSRRAQEWKGLVFAARTHCRERLIDHPENPAYRRVMDAFGELGLHQVYIRGAGCEECKGTGTLGRIKAGEIIITNSEFLRRALSGDTSGAVRYWLEEMDGRTLKEAAMSLMLQGIIGVDELERWVGLLDRPGVY